MIEVEHTVPAVAYIVQDQNNPGLRLAVIRRLPQTMWHALNSSAKSMDLTYCGMRIRGRRVRKLANQAKHFSPQSLADALSGGLAT